MWSEPSQFDIPDRQLRATSPQSRDGRWTDIGKAEITHTIFGKAKVRIIRKQDNSRRAWLLAALAATALAAAAGQQWLASQQTEPLQSAPPRPIVLPSNPIAPQTGSSNLENSQKSAPQQPPAKQITAQPQPARLATNNAPKSRAVMKPPISLSSPIQPEVQTDAIPPAAQPAANTAATIAPPVEPLSKEVAAISPAGSNQPAAPTNSQPSP